MSVIILIINTLFSDILLTSCKKKKDERHEKGHRWALFLHPLATRNSLPQEAPPRKKLELENIYLPSAKALG